MSMRIARLLLAASCALASTAAADEGGVEINHAGALMGIDPGDPPGYPVTIFNPGKYRLTGDLTPPAGVNAIDMMGSDVILDMGGHQIIGSGAGGVGIQSMAGPAQTNVTIRDGGVRGMNAGIEMPDSLNVTLQNMRLAANMGPGFRLGWRSRVEAVVAHENQGCGGEVRSGSSVSGSSFTGNMDCGLRAGSSSQLDELLINDNMMIGLSFEGGGAGHDLHVARNGAEGIKMVESTDPPGPGPGPGPYPARPTFELTDVTVSTNGTGGMPGLRVENAVAKIRNGTFAGNGMGIDAMMSDLTLGSVVLSENAGPGLFAYSSNVRLDEVSVHGNGLTGGSGLILSGPMGELTAEGLQVYDHEASGIEVLDVGATLHDFVVRNNGTGVGSAPGIMFSGGPLSVLTLRRGTIKNNVGPGLECTPAATLRVLHGGLHVHDNGAGAIVGCLPTEVTPSFCDPPGGGPGSC